MADSYYTHPYQASTEGRRTRTYRTAESRDTHAQQWADEIQQTVNLWQHSTADGWEMSGRVQPASVQGSCKEPGCEAEIEANPLLYMSLAADGTWTIRGVEDNEAHIQCAEGHPQGDPELRKSLSAFLEETFPGGTWPTSQ